MKTLPPFGAEARGIRYPSSGAHRAPGQTIGSCKGPSTTGGPLLESLVNHLSRGPRLVLADLVLEARTLKVGESLPKT